MSFSENSFQNGQCFTAFLRFQNNDGSFVSDNKGKQRPVIILQDPIDSKFYAFKVTGQVHKSLNKKYGYQLRDWKEAGFRKPSIIKCNIDNRFEIEPYLLHRNFGQLTENDLRGFLTQLIKVRKMEHENDNEIER